MRFSALKREGDRARPSLDVFLVARVLDSITESRERIRAHAAAIARSAVSFEDVKECRALLHGKPLDVVRDEVLAMWCGFVLCFR